MIRVQVKRQGNNEIISFAVKGHAGYAPHGEDIVCAAVSALVQTTVLGIAENIGLEPEVTVKDGYLGCELPAMNEKEKELVYLLVEVMLTGLREIKKQYPKYLYLDD